MVPQLATLGRFEADEVCQSVINADKPVNRSQKLEDLGIKDAGMVALFSKLVRAVKARNCTLDPNALACLTCGSTYGAMVDLVAKASRP